MNINLKNKKFVMSFDKSKFNFHKLFSSHLSNIAPGSLSDMHQNLDTKFLPTEVVTEANDQELDLYSYLYQIDPGYILNKNMKTGLFLKTYLNLVNFLAQECFQERLIYQTKPTIRVQFPGNKAVGSFHRDRDYNHPMEEINCWLPITSVFNTNTIWLESVYKKEDFSPVNMSFGELLLFDSGLTHGNKINIENKTRLSFDFRVIPLSRYKPSTTNPNNNSVVQNLEFKIGSYYQITD